MLGLLIKDFYETFCIKINLFGICFGIGSIISIGSNTEADTVPYEFLATVFLPVFAYYLLLIPKAYEQDSKFKLTLLTFPFTRKEIVQIKILSTYIFMLIINVFISLPIMCLHVYGYETMDIQLGLYIWLFGLIFSFVVTPIMNVCIEFIGCKEILMLVICVCWMYILSIISLKLDIAHMIWETMNASCFFAFCIMIIVNIVCYYAYRKIYDRKFH